MAIVAVIPIYFANLKHVDGYEIKFTYRKRMQYLQKCSEGYTCTLYCIPYICTCHYCMQVRYLKKKQYWGNKKKF